jgi:RNA polymerase sigma-70 factor (ECF subfamily)
MMQAADFASLLSSAQRGDEAAFVDLFRLTQPRLLRYLRVMAGALAEDVAGDTWVSVVGGLTKFEGDTLEAFHAWVLSIARRRWVDEVRRRSRHPEALTAEIPEQTSGDCLADGAADSDAAAQVIGLLRRLPRDQADAVTMRVVMDMDVASTAAAMGKKPGTVRVLAFRGLRRLAVLLEEAGGTQDSEGVTQTAALPILHGDRE